MKIASCFALLVGCATGPRTPISYLNPADVWPDFAPSIEVLRCAVSEVEGREFADRLLNIPFVAIENYHLAGCYDASADSYDGCGGNQRPPAIYLGTQAENAWGLSPLRWEVLCRRRLHLLEGNERRCTNARMEQEIKPLYRLAIERCHREIMPRRRTEQP